MEKRQVRSLERECRKADPSRAAAATAAWMARRRAYRDLLRLKHESFWTAKVDSEKSRPYQLWQSVDSLMGQGFIPSPAGVSASDFHRFFDVKVEGVRASTSSAPPPTLTGAPPRCLLHRFELLADDDVIMAVRQLPNKHCLSDPMPTTLLKNNIKVLAPFLTDLFNLQ